MNTHNYYRIERIEPSKIKIDYSYMQQPNKRRIELICKSYDNSNTHFFKLPEVSHRDDGFYYVFRGQHTVLAHKKKFGDDTPIECKVFDGLTKREEYELRKEYYKQLGKTHCKRNSNQDIKTDEKEINEKEISEKGCSVLMAHETYMAVISPSKIKVDPRYQRLLNAAKVNKICKNFNMDLFNPPKVSHRADGFYYVFDGQNSLVAHRIQFGDDTPINCKVFEGLTYDDEADLFIQQTGISSKVTDVEKLRAKYSMSDSDVKDMVDAAKLCGVVIDFRNYNGENHISAVSAAYSIWKFLGKDNFINVLCVIKEAWFGAGDSYTAGFLKGLAYIYKHYGHEIKNKNIVDALKRNTPVWYASRAKDKHGSLMLQYAQVFIEQYNKGKRNRLEEPKNK